MNSRENIEKRIIVVGARGYIGKELLKKAAEISDVIGTSSDGRCGLMHLDLGCPAAFDYSILSKFDVILLAAAISAPDTCAQRQEYSRGINVEGTSEFIYRAMGRGARVIFFSSDTVYGEYETRFDESADCNPAGEYALMKREVECRFEDSQNFKSIRLSYVFSREDKFSKYLISCATKGELAELYHPFYRAVIHRNDVVDGVLSLAKRWDEFPQRIINFGGPDILSRIEFANYIKNIALNQLKYTSLTPEAEFFKNRPRIISMLSPVLGELINHPVHTLCEAAKLEFMQAEKV